jgi:hypothetical protein
MNPGEPAERIDPATWETSFDGSDPKEAGVC